MSQGQRGRILVVDDEPHVCELIVRWLLADGYDCAMSFSAEQALVLLEEHAFQLVISDIMMPGISGVDLLHTIRKRFPTVAVLMVTAVDDRQTGTRCLELGAYGYVIKPFQRNELLINVASALQRREMSLLNDEYDGNLRGHLLGSSGDIREQQELTLRTIALSGKAYGETATHVRRVGAYASLLSGALRPGQTIKALENLALAAAMHDLGNIGVPDRILLKPDRLSAEETSSMRNHTNLGAKLFRDLDGPLMKQAREIAFTHHERWDGSGYPGGLAGEAIPESARIVAVADVYDALLHDRPYRAAYDEEKALTMMMAERARHFDPKVLDCFFRILPEIQSVGRRLTEAPTGKRRIISEMKRQ